MPKRDYYDVLGIERSASEAELKRAFKRLARRHHPDVNPGDKKAEERFKEISEAYAVLSDADKRRRYDAMGHAAFGGGSPWGEGGAPPSMEDILREFGLGDILGGMFGGGRDPRGGGFRTHPPPPQRGQDVNYSMEIGFDDALKGLHTTITVPKTTSRDGRAQRGAERIQVRIPPGVSTGSRVRLAGKGESSLNGGGNGDLFIVTKVREHPFFERRGDNLYLELPVSLGEALLGARVEINTFEGASKMTIPPSTQNGQVFRLSGKGAPRLKGGGKGDLFVTIRVLLPEGVDEESKEMIREFERRNPTSPRAKMTGVSL